MNIFFIGQLNQGTTTEDRMNALKRLGHSVYGFNVFDFQSKNRVLRSLQSRFNFRFLLEELNEELIHVAKELVSIDLIWIDKGVWIFPETLDQLKNKLHAKTLHFTPDSQLIINRSKHFESCISLYDYLITTKSFEVDLYIEMGASKVVLSQQSYCPLRYSSPETKSEYSCDVGFISDFKPHYGRLISQLSKLGFEVKAWGPKWKRAESMRKIPKGVVQGNGLWSEDYINALASFKIGLGLLSKYIPEQHTTRTFEIPAAGTFLLAERTKEHQQFFEEGVEAEFFDSQEEMIEKATYFLQHDDERERIALAGRERCIKSGYDTNSVISKILKEINLE